MNAAVTEEPSGARDARNKDTADDPSGSPHGPANSGLGVPTSNCMVSIREVTSHPGKWVARIVTTGYADGPADRSPWPEEMDTGPKIAGPETATGS